jgi:nucleoid DNA-binding protein
LNFDAISGLSEAIRSLMTPTREAITRSIFDRLHLSKPASVKAVETTLESIKKTLEAGEDVLITDFEKLCVKDKGKRWAETRDRRGPGAGRVKGCDLQVFEGCWEEDSMVRRTDLRDQRRDEVELPIVKGRPMRPPGVVT